MESNEKQPDKKSILISTEIHNEFYKFCKKHALTMYRVVENLIKDMMELENK